MGQWMILFLLSATMASLVEGRRYQRTNEILLGERNREKVFTVRLGDYVELLCPDLSDVDKITVYRVNKDQYDNCEVSQEEEKIWECDESRPGSKMTLRIQSYSPSRDGYKFQSNTDYFFLARQPDAFGCADHHKIKMTVEETKSRRKHHPKRIPDKITSPSTPLATTTSTTTTTKTTPPATTPAKKTIASVVAEKKNARQANLLQDPKHHKLIGSSSTVMNCNLSLLLSSLFLLRMVI